jgi:hypothetical protein
MSKTLEIPDPLYEALTELAAQKQQAPTDLLVEWMQQRGGLEAPATPGVTLESARFPESAEVRLHLDVSARLNVTDTVARRRVTAFVIQKVGNLLGTDRPYLAVNDRWYWVVPVVLTFPEVGPVGRVGEVRVDAQTGEILADQNDVDNLQRNALALAERAAL